MVVTTNSPDIIEKVRHNYSNFIDMTILPPSKDLEEITDYLFHRNKIRTREYEKTNSITFTPENCINCWRCIRMCSDIQNIGALNDANPKMKNNECISCGQCVSVCPTTALTTTSSITQVLKAIVEQKVMVLQTAPSVRVAIGEIFGEPIGKINTGKMISAARKIGFKYIFDTNFGADVCICEEGTELLGRLQSNGPFPMFTSCCPAWVNYVEKLHPELIPNLSTTKSPHMILARLVKTYWAPKMNIDPKKIFSVSLMPCVAKKDEIKRMQFGNNDVDAVITTNEFGDMLKLLGIEWRYLNDLNSYDDLMGDSTGGAAIFGVTGGVCESAVRFAHDVLIGSPLQEMQYSQWRGMNSIKACDVKIGTVNLSIAVCNGIAAAVELIDTGKYQSFQFIEVMACPCGCIGGAGQPKLKSKKLVEKRAHNLYNIDKFKQLKISSWNPQVKLLYKTFLGHPGSHIAHELLHTHYEPQETILLAKRKLMRTRPIVAYGSSSGTSMKFARFVANSFGSLSVSINSLTIDEVLKRGTAVFVISTAGDGEFPPNSKKFIEALRNSFEDLTTVKFAVAGVGSHNYRKFCEAGKQLYALLDQHCAKPILPFTTIDSASEDKGETTFENWIKNLCSILNYKMPRISVKVLYHFEKVGNAAMTSVSKPTSFDMSHVVKREELMPSDYSKKITLLELKLPQSIKINYGDNIEILPQNDDELVENVLKSLDLDPDQIYKMEFIEHVQDCIIPEITTTRQLFSQYLDLSGPPNRSIMKAFLQTANDEGSIVLENILNGNERSLLEFMKSISTGEFMIRFAKYGVPSLDMIASACQHTRPRIFSIASSPIADARTIKIVVSLVTFGENKEKEGMCGKYLRSNRTQVVPMRVINGGFSFPRDKSTPMIFIALGGGIAPILSLLEHRSCLNACGPAIRFYGCKNKAGYQKIIDIIENAKKENYISESYYAFSKDNCDNRNILDAMKANIKLLWEKYWSDSRTVIYYCGHSGDIIDQICEIMLNATVSVGGLNIEEAHVYSGGHSILVESFDY